MDAVLDHKALRRLNAQRLSREQKQVRMRLAARYALSAEYPAGELIGEAQNRQAMLDTLLRAGRGDTARHMRKARDECLNALDGAQLRIIARMNKVADAS